MRGCGGVIIICLYRQGCFGNVLPDSNCRLFSRRLNRLTTDFSVIVESLRKSKAGLMEISEDKTKIRRSPDKPLPEVNDEYKDALKHKSVYLVSLWIPLTFHPSAVFGLITHNETFPFLQKGFPLETTLDEVQEWLNGKGNIENIQMRRNLQRQFKVRAWIHFPRHSDRNQISLTLLSLWPGLSFPGSGLWRISQAVYSSSRCKKI